MLKLDIYANRLMM